MANLTQQRDLVISLKKETLSNVGILSKLYPMSSELCRLLEENNLEKPTQNLFNHLAYYLINIIDPQVSLPWPLYDTKMERTYRNEVSVFIADYSAKGLLSPVMSSYLVNPSCYKVTVLIFQMSQLAVQRVVLKKMDKDYQKKLYNEMTERYKSQKDENFIESIEKETEVMWSKFSNYLHKKESMERFAKMIRDGIIHMEDKMKKLKPQEFINNLVDSYIKTHQLDEETKKEILEIKNVNKQAKYFDKWLQEFDRKMSTIESDWDSRTQPLLEISHKTYHNTETLIARQTGEVDKRTFMVEYNPKTDYINTEELEKQVNMQQKYILKNITKEEKLNFPNLIRGFLISISFILKNTEIGNEIYQFNEYLNDGKRSYNEIVNSMRILLERVMTAEEKLQCPQETFSSTVSTRDFAEIPPLPDLSDIKMNREYHPQVIFDTFTPLHFNKHQFNLHKQRTGSFIKPLPKFATPFHHKLPNKDDFFKSLISCRVSAYDNMNVTQNTNLNLSVMSQANSKGNETIAECTSGFTKQQICRLLSTKKSTSSKKFKHKRNRPDVKIIKGNLFNESTLSINENSIHLFRSHSSPNLYENRDKRSRNLQARKLSIMKEDSPSLLEVSGIAALERDSSHSTPQGMISLESSRKLIDAASLPSIVVTPGSDISRNSNADDLNKEIDLNKGIEFKEPKIRPIHRKSKEKYEECMLKQQKKVQQAFEEYAVLPQRKSNEMYKEQNIQAHRRSTETFETQTMLPESNSKDIFEEVTLSQRRSTELFEEPKAARKSKELIEEHNIALQRKSTESLNGEVKSETPKNNPQLVKKTSSLEKIINRFKKVRASVLPTESKEDEFRTIFEEKENQKVVNFDVFTANRNLLPDLLSPSCSIITPKSTDFIEPIYFDSDDEKIEKPRRPRESLGTALGVDNTFLDQFDLID